MARGKVTQGTSAPKSGTHRAARSSAPASERSLDERRDTECSGVRHRGAGEIGAASAFDPFYAVLALLALVILVGCGSTVDPCGDTSPNAEEAGGDAGLSPAPVDRACVPGEQGNVTGFALSLAGYGCTEIVNRSGITGGRSWCCPSGTFATDTAGAGGAL